MSELESASAEIETGKSELREADALIVEWTTKVVRARLKTEIVSDLFAPTFSDPDLENTSRVETVRELVSLVDDPAISAKFEAWSANPADRDLAVEAGECI